MGNMILHMEPEAVYHHLMAIQRLLETHEQNLESELNTILRSLPHLWQAPAAEEFRSRLRGLRLAALRMFREALDLNRLARKEYRQWLAVDGKGLWYPWSAAVVNWLDQEWIGTALETLDTFDTWRERIDTFTPFFRQMGALVLTGGYVAGLKGTITAGGVQRFSSLGAMLDDVSTIAAKRGVRTFKRAFRGIGAVLQLGLEVWEEVPENWDQSGGDPLRFALRMTTETAVGLVTDAAVAGAGAWAGAMALGTIGGTVAGPVGAVVGAKLGSTIGAAVASALAERFRIGGIPVGEWLEDRLSDMVVDFVETPWKVLDEAKEKVIRSGGGGSSGGW